MGWSEPATVHKLIQPKSSKAKVRAATFDDVPTLVGMGQRFIRESSYKGKIANNAASLTKLMRRLLSDDEGVIFVLEANDNVVGMIGAFVYEHPMSGERIAGEAFWWVEPEKRGRGLQLMRAVERWADEKGAVRLTMIAPTENVGRLYRACGYEPLETHYQKDL